MYTTEIQDLLAALAANARSGDVDGIMSCYHPTVRAFDFGQTRRAIDLEGVRENCQAGYAGVSGLMYEFQVEKIEVAEGMAYCYGLEHISGEKDSQPLEMYACATYIFGKFEDRWLIVHQHLTATE
jgi:ketosteroid isomerase-like protein